MPDVKYSVYVIELKKEFSLTKKAQEHNPRQEADKPCVYVGYTSKTPEQRFKQHMEGARNKRGPLYSRVVFKYGIRLLPNEYERFNPIRTKEEAEKKEKELTEKLRRKGYTVWSN